MNLLLDSHTFIWWRDDTRKLSTAALAEISNPQNNVYVSVVSAWEIQIKISLNKLAIRDGLEKAIQEEQSANGFQLLPIQLSHAVYLKNLPLIHNDPFDRLLIAQALVENMTLVSSDQRFGGYGVQLIW